MFELKPFHVNAQTENVTICSEAFVKNNLLAFRFVLKDPERVIYIPNGPKERQDNLWQSTCLEAFWSESGTLNYWEMNISPCGAWNLYKFNDYRIPTPPVREERILNISFESVSRGNETTFKVEVPLENLFLDNKKLDVSLTSVIEFKNKEKSYFAIRHVNTKPDFHQRESFVCNLG